MMGRKTRYALIIAAIFFLSSMAAAIISIARPELIPFQIATKESMKLTASSNLNDTFLSLLINNLFISFIIISSSIGRQKVLPAAIIAANGFSIGGTIFKVVQVYGAEMLIPFLPHAIIELPAIVLVGTFTFVAIDEIKRVSPYSTITEYLTAKLKIPRQTMNQYIFKPYFFYVVPMFVVAAAVEAYISAQLLVMVVSTV